MSDFYKDSMSFEFESLARSFKRHRSLIILLKFVLPAVAAILALALIVYPMLYPQEKKILIESIPVAQGNTNPAMVNPHFSGFDKDKQPYNINAERAYQQDPRKIFMENLTADIMLKNGTWASIVTPKGLYDMDARTILMTEIYEVFMTEANTQTSHVTGKGLFVDVDGQIIKSDNPVSAESPMGTLKATGFTLYNNESKITFKGPVKLVIKRE